MEEEGRAIGIGRRQNHVQPDVGRLPGVAHRDGVAVEPIHLLDALEAVVDEEGLRCQGVVRIHALLHSSSHVVVLECQAVCPLVGLDHAVLAVPYLRLAACRINGTVGHRAVQVVGKIYLHIVFCGGRVLVEAVGDVGPRHTRFIGGDSVADGVVGVEVRVGRVNIGPCPRQLVSVIVGVGDDIRSGVRAAGSGHGGSPADGVVHVAVGGDCAVLHLRDEIAVLLVGPGGGDSVGTRHQGGRHTLNGVCRCRWQTMPGMCRMSIHWSFLGHSLKF